MSSILMKLVWMSLSASVIAMVLFTIKPFVKNRLSQKWQYYIWLIVMLRMIIPFTPEISLMGSLYDPHTLDFAAVPGFAGIALKYSGLLWLCVSLILLAKKVISYSLYNKFIRANRKEINDSEILKVYNEACGLVGAGMSVSVYSGRFIASPMLVGFIKPFIMLPESMLTYPAELKYIFLHELTHYKRKDFLYKWLVQLASCFCFFNPALFLLRREINRSCELSCDETAVGKLDRPGKKAYGSALIHALEVEGLQVRPAAASLMMCEEARQVRARLDAILRRKPSSRRVTAATFLLTAFICFCSVYVGVAELAYANTGCKCAASERTQQIRR